MNLSRLFFAVFLLTLTGSSPRAEQWLELFGRPAITGNIKSVAEMNGLQFVAGDILSVGDQRASGLVTYNPATEQWAAIPLEFDSVVRHQAVFKSATGETLLVAEEFNDGRVIRLNGSSVHIDQLDGNITGLVFADFPAGPQVLATGSFRFENAIYALAVWDGDGWTTQLGFAPLGTVAAIRPPVVVHFEGRTQVILNLNYDFAATWDGQNSQPIFRTPFSDFQSFGQFGSLNNELLNCNPSGIFRLIGGQWKIHPFSVSGCGQIANRKTSDGDQLAILAGSRELLFTDGTKPPAPDPAYAGMLPRDLVPLGERLAVVDASSNLTANSYSLWNGENWTRPTEAATQKAQAKANFLESVSGAIFLGGEFNEAGSELNSNAARWQTGGPEPFMAMPEGAQLQAVSTDLTTFFGTTQDALVVTTESTSQSIPFSFPNNLPPIYRSLEYFDATNVFLGGCLDTLFRFDGFDIAPAGAARNFQCGRTLHAIRPPSAAAGIYAVGNGPLVADKSSPPLLPKVILRWDGSDWQDITPPEFLEHRFFNFERVVLSSFSHAGGERLFAAVGTHMGYFDGASWTLFPALPSANFTGPVAAFERDGQTCFYVINAGPGFTNELVQRCKNRWFRSDRLVVDGTITGLKKSDYLNRPVLLASGEFFASGKSTQGGLAVLDLDLLMADGMEFFAP